MVLSVKLLHWASKPTGMGETSADRQNYKNHRTKSPTYLKSQCKRIYLERLTKASGNAWWICSQKKNTGASVIASTSSYILLKSSTLPPLIKILFQSLPWYQKCSMKSKTLYPSKVKAYDNVFVPVLEYPAKITFIFDWNLDTNSGVAYI